MSKIFIAYVRKDNEFVRELQAELRRVGHYVWIDEQLLAGDEFEPKIRKAIEVASACIVVISTDALQSEWFGAELRYALDVQRKRGRERFSVILLSLSGATLGPLEKLYGEEPYYIPVSTTSGRIDAATLDAILAALDKRPPAKDPPTPPSRASTPQSEMSALQERAPALVSNALRKNLQRANAAAEDIGPLLYATLRRDGLSEEEVAEVLGATIPGIPLRIASYTPPTSEGVRLRPPGPVAAIHTGDDRTMVVRCSNALIFIDERERATTVPVPRLTASALHRDVLITGDAEGTVSFWNTSSGAIQGRMAAHRAEVTQVLIAADAAFSCAADGTIVRWNGFQLTARFDAPAGISTADISGQSLVAGCRNGDIFEITPERTTLHPRAHDGAVTGIAFRLDARVIVSAGADRRIRACLPGSPETASRIDSGHTFGVSGLAVSSNQSHFATYAADRTVRTWFVDDEGPTVISGSVSPMHSAAVTTARFGRRGSDEVLVAGYADGAVMVSEMDGSLGTQHRHQGPVRAIVVRDDETITAGDDRQIERSYKGNELVPGFQDGVTECVSTPITIGFCRNDSVELRIEGSRDAHPRVQAGSLAIRDDGRRVLLWTTGGTGVVLWNVVTSDIEDESTFTEGVVRCAFHRNIPVVALDNGDLSVISGPLLRPHRGAITALATNGYNLFTGGVDGAVVQNIIISIGGPEAITEIGSHSSPVTVIAATSDLVASGAANGEVVVWRGDEARSALFRARHDARVTHVAFPATRDLFVSACEDHHVTIWNYRTGERVGTCVGHRDRITALVVDDRSEIIYTSSLDGTVRAWDLAGKQRGIVYGDHPFSAMCLIYGEVMPGDLLAGDDAGALTTLTYRGDGIVTSPQ